ncbi:DUF2059 domain-containing protein [Microvirga sp. W0021]|uniref:DUF2059 domain-containing protein n=1 Tax=Hohaiivirga grylli TaxID=3133970 RepID=A0ABV0BLP6_9HYPH
MRLTSSLAAVTVAFSLLTGTAMAQAPAPAQQNSAPALDLSKKQFTASHLAIAKEVADASGISRSFNGVVDQILDQVRQITVTRPEMKDDLEKVITALKPELELQQAQISNAATRVFANFLTEAELKDIDAFFKTPSGKKYIESQPQILDAFVNEFQNWSRNLGDYIMIRVRAEMTKLGHKF